ncbi:unnamed protein product [Trifolium pratense]|nr:unnamed protein product [Trifolium pratense]
MHDCVGVPYQQGYTGRIHSCCQGNSDSEIMLIQIIKKNVEFFDSAILMTSDHVILLLVKDIAQPHGHL